MLLPSLGFVLLTAAPVAVVASSTNIGLQHLDKRVIPSPPCVTAAKPIAPKGFHCNQQATLRKPAPIVPASTFSSLDDCRNACVDNHQCRSFGYAASTGQCNLYGKHLDGQGIKSSTTSKTFFSARFCFKVTCPPWQTYCPGTGLTNTQTDSQNCGTCGNSCGSYACTAGLCSFYLVASGTGDSNVDGYYVNTKHGHLLTIHDQEPDTEGTYQFAIDATTRQLVVIGDLDDPVHVLVGAAYDGAAELAEDYTASPQDGPIFPTCSVPDGSTALACSAVVNDEVLSGFAYADYGGTNFLYLSDPGENNSGLYPSVILTPVASDT